MYIYKITNLINNKVYIGQCSKPWIDSLDYYGSGCLIKKAIIRHKKENFTKELLEECSSKKELDISEKYWILHYKEKLNAILYNITDGGTGGITYIKGDDVYESCKSKLGRAGKSNPGSRPEVIAKRVSTINTKIANGIFSASGKNHSNYKGVLETKANKYKGGIASSNATQIEIDGIKYDSYKAASRVFGIAGETISRRCKSDKYINWKIIKEYKKDDKERT
jgi:group I intron endonuclease